MMQNTLTVKVDRPLHELFAFCITPPNSSRWIPGIVAEETNEWPVGVGTVYRLQNEAGEWTEVAVTDIKDNELVEFSKGEYHCRYTFESTSEQSSELTYHEWVDSGELDPFNQETLEHLKQVVERDSR